jgi:hypothetical protein
MDAWAVKFIETRPREPHRYSHEAVNILPTDAKMM